MPVNVSMTPNPMTPNPMTPNPNGHDLHDLHDLHYFRMRLDLDRCIGCRACEVACVTANDITPTISRNWVPHLLAAPSQADGLAVFAPYLCSHCAEPPCVPACPTGASFIARDGRVLVDKDLCIGCGLCVDACPYDARLVDKVTKKLEKCTLCEARVEAGLAPACFEVCPAGARHFEEVRAMDGAPMTIRVGDIEQIDPGHEVTLLVSEAVNPGPRLRFSGRPEQLKLLHAKRPPTQEASLPGLLWTKGLGTAVQVMGYAAIAAMGAMLGLKAIKARQRQHAAAASSPGPTPGSDHSLRSPTPGSDQSEDSQHGQ